MVPNAKHEMSESDESNGENHGTANNSDNLSLSDRQMETLCWLSEQWPQW